MLVTYLSFIIYLILGISVCHGLLFDRLKERKQIFFLCCGSILGAVILSHMIIWGIHYIIPDAIYHKRFWLFVGWLFCLSTGFFYLRVKQADDEDKSELKKFYIVRQSSVWLSLIVLYFSSYPKTHSLISVTVLWVIISGCIFMFCGFLPIQFHIKEKQKITFEKGRHEAFEKDILLKEKYEKCVEQQKNRMERFQRFKEQIIEKQKILSTVFQFLGFLLWFFGGIFVFIASLISNNKTCARHYPDLPKPVDNLFSAMNPDEEMTVSEQNVRTTFEMDYQWEQTFFKLCLWILISVSGCLSVFLWCVLDSDSMVISPYEIGIPFGKNDVLYGLAAVMLLVVFFLTASFANKKNPELIYISPWHPRQIFTRRQFMNLIGSLAIGCVLSFTSVGIMSVGAKPSHAAVSAYFSPVVRVFYIKTDDSNEDVISVVRQMKIKRKKIRKKAKHRELIDDWEVQSY